MNNFNFLSERSNGVLLSHKEVESNIPVLFDKKSKHNVVKPLTYIESDTGKTRHYTPAAQEWFNSIYNYNNNYAKSLPVADTNLMKILKSYFNLQLIPKLAKNLKGKKAKGLIVKPKELKVESKKKGKYKKFKVKFKGLIVKRIPTKARRLSSKRIFVGRGDIKHTNSKVLITFYVHNTERIFLEKAIRAVYKALYLPKKRLEITVVTKKSEKEILSDHDNTSLSDHMILAKYKHCLNADGSYSVITRYNSIPALNKSLLLKTDNSKNQIIRYNRILTLKEFLLLSDHFTKWYKKFVVNYLDLDLQNLYLINLDKQYSLLSKSVNNKLLAIEDKDEIMLRLSKKIGTFHQPDFNTYLNLVKESYINNLKRFKYLLLFNKAKFTKTFMKELTGLVEKIYGKRVEFNIINLNKMHLNSDIFTQAVSLKLKNRDNKLYRVLKSSLRKVKIPFEARSTKLKKMDKNEVFVNKIRNKTISSMFKDDSSMDSLNSLLLNFFPSADNLMVNIMRRTSVRKRSIPLLYYVLNSIKHRKVRGVRVEAKGRLTRRFTASRSVFKMKWKGGLKNIESSFKGLSAITLRGYAKSNVQYSFMSSKNRNGAFGVKGWVSSK